MTLCFLGHLTYLGDALDRHNLVTDSVTTSCTAEETLLGETDMIYPSHERSQRLLNILRTNLNEASNRGVVLKIRVKLGTHFQGFQL